MSGKPPRSRTRISSFWTVVVLFSVTLLLVLLGTGAIAKESKPKAKNWQIQGITAALEDDRSGVKVNALNKLASYDSQSLKPLIPEKLIQSVGAILQDDKQASLVRGSAADALGNLGEAAKLYIPDILNFIKDDKQDSNVRGSAAMALTNIAKLNFQQAIYLLELANEEGQTDRLSVDSWRFYSYLMSGSDQDIRVLLRWTAKPAQRPTQLSHTDGVNTLKVFQSAWSGSQDLPKLREDLAECIAQVATTVTWKTEDLPLLKQHYDNLKADRSTHANSLQAAITSLETWQWAFGFRNAIAIHALFWAALIFAYPRFPQVQAVFF